MHYKMKAPCDACPFRKGSGFAYRRLLEFSSGEFPCHKASALVENAEGINEYVSKGEKTPHCAGALIFNEKRERPHQMMRISERLGFYDMRELEMDSDVGVEPEDFRSSERKSKK